MAERITLLDMGSSPSGKTRRWEVQNAGGATLGWVQWWAAWRRYVFQPTLRVVLDPECLREIAGRVEAETVAQKAAGR